MATNKENAQRLREMNAALSAGNPIAFGDAYQTALEAGAKALEGSDADARAPTAEPATPDE